jgi:hypothetical protein
LRIKHLVVDIGDLGLKEDYYHDNKWSLMKAFCRHLWREDLNHNNLSRPTQMIYFLLHLKRSLNSITIALPQYKKVSERCFIILHTANAFAAQHEMDGKRRANEKM